MTADGFKLERPNKQPRPVYMGDERLDKLMSALLEMAAQIYVLHDRQRALEAILERHGLAVTAEVEQFEPDAAWLAARGQEREAFIERLLADFIEK